MAMDTKSIIVAASGWLVALVGAAWRFWVWHHKRRATREPEKTEAELGLLAAQTAKLRTETELLDTQIEGLRNRQTQTSDGDEDLALVLQQRDDAIAVLLECRRLHEEGRGLTGFAQACYAVRYAWALRYPKILESTTLDKDLENAREAFEIGRDLAVQYLSDVNLKRLDYLRILAKELGWDTPEDTG